MTLWTENVGIAGSLGGYTYANPPLQQRSVAVRQPRAFANTLDVVPEKRMRLGSAMLPLESFKKPKISRHRRTTIPVLHARPRVPKGFRVRGACERGIHTALLRMVPCWPATIDMTYEQLLAQLASEMHTGIANTRRFVFARLIEMFPTRTALAARACGISKRYAAVTLRLWRINQSA